MAEKTIRVIWFEDDEKYIENSKPFFEKAGIEIVAILKTIEESREFLEKINDMSVDAAIIDGNLLEDGKPGNFEDHAWEIAKKIKGLELGIVSIGFSSKNLGYYQIDKDIGKQSGINVLINYLLTL
jgi:hypothetical protein